MQRKGKVLLKILILVSDTQVREQAEPSRECGAERKYCAAERGRLEETAY
jgi:hypothetical protein